MTASFHHMASVYTRAWKLFQRVETGNLPPLHHRLGEPEGKGPRPKPPLPVDREGFPRLRGADQEEDPVRPPLCRGGTPRA
ncbi:O-antigen polymerase [Thermus thermophilus]|nr:O-antigen polymerase [Thermus thermophilus]BDB12004.1 hypothetical protein TthTMY_17430 [Thermus thermophilus]